MRGHDQRFRMESVPGAAEYAVKRFREGAKGAKILDELRAIHPTLTIGKSGFYEWFGELKKANELDRESRFQVEAKVDQVDRLESLVERLEKLIAEAIRLIARR